MSGMAAVGLAAHTALAQVAPERASAYRRDYGLSLENPPIVQLVPAKPAPGGGDEDPSG